MSTLVARLRKFYGSHPLHLLTMAAGFALAGYAVFTFNPATLWNPHPWWQSIAVWLAAAILFHDFALFPLYALADRLLGTASRRRQRRPRGHRRGPALRILRLDHDRTQRWHRYRRYLGMSWLARWFRRRR